MGPTLAGSQFPLHIDRLIDTVAGYVEDQYNLNQKPEKKKEEEFVHNFEAPPRRRNTMIPTLRIG